MNLKKFFYRDYYQISGEVETGRGQREHRKFNLEKSSDLEKWKKIKAFNEPLMKIANDKLTSYKLDKSATKSLNFKENSGKQVQTIPLRTTYPGLFTGSGYNHETGNQGELSLGFYFDHTSGLPILSGSSVKGTLRSAFPHFDINKKNPLLPEKENADLKKRKAEFLADMFGWPKKEGHPDFEKIHQLELAIFEGLDVPATAEKSKSTRGKSDEESSPACFRPMSRHDVFLDAFISDAGKDKHILGMDSITPHNENPLKNPIPLPFLKILPDVEFTFQFLLHDSELADGTIIKVSDKIRLFSAILCTFGAGAKTNVGYGQFVDPEAIKKVEKKVPQQGDAANTRHQAVEKAKMTELPNNTKKLNQGDNVIGQLAEKGIENYVYLLVNGEKIKVRMAGNCPLDVGGFMKLQISFVEHKSQIIKLVRYSGPA